MMGERGATSALNASPIVGDALASYSGLVGRSVLTALYQREKPFRQSVTREVEHFLGDLPHRLAPIEWASADSQGVAELGHGRIDLPQGRGVMRWRSIRRELPPHRLQPFQTLADEGVGEEVHRAGGDSRP
jgi:hypothetical protein